MAQKTLIGGTAYKISGGKTLVDGTAYSIEGGNTLVGGTVHAISFDPRITVFGVPPIMELGSVAYVKVNDELLGEIMDVEGDGKSYNFPVGTVVFCEVGAGQGATATISINGETVLSHKGSSGLFGATWATYDYVVTTDATIAFEEILTDEFDSWGNRIKYGIITITEH